MLHLMTPGKTVRHDVDTALALPAGQMVRIFNAGTGTAFIRFGASDVAAASDGNEDSMPIPAGGVLGLTVPGSASHLRVLRSGGSVYVTGGYGV
jgi:hypothetical protein